MILVRSKPGSYFFGAGGGLGFGLAAALGVQLAQPSRPVVCVLGEGSAQYAILKWFAELEGVTGAPGLDLPRLDCVALASAYGVRGTRVEGRDELRDALANGLAGEGPALVEVPVTPGMALA